MKYFANQHTAAKFRILLVTSLKTQRSVIFDFGGKGQYVVLQDKRTPPQHNVHLFLGTVFLHLKQNGLFR